MDIYIYVYFREETDTYYIEIPENSTPTTNSLQRKPHQSNVVSIVGPVPRSKQFSTAPDGSTGVLHEASSNGSSFLDILFPDTPCMPYMGLIWW